jgi:hypothetical protein
VKKVLAYFIFYLAWIVVFALGFLFIFRSLNVLNFFLQGRLLNPGDLNDWLAGKQHIFIEEIYVICIGIALLIAMLVAEEYLRRGVRKGKLILYIAKVFAPMLFLLFLTDLLTLVATGTTNSILFWLIMLVELGLAFVLFEYGRSAWPFAKQSKKL